MDTKIKLSSLAFLAIAGLSLVFSKGTNAQIANQALTVIPPTLEVKVNPGETLRKTIQFRNDGDQTVYLSTAVKDYVVNDTNGTPDFINVPTSGRWSAASWTRVSPSTLAVAPRQVVNVQVSVNVPLDARPGGHYAAIIYESGAGKIQRIGTNLGAGSGTTQVVGTLMYLTVSGPVTESAFVKRFEAARFLEYGPVEFESEILNQSDMHIAPKGQIEIRDTLGKTVAVLPLDPRNIFPGASLVYKNSWNEKNVVGRFRADLVATYGNQGKVMTATIFFWVLPWKVVTLTLLTILLVVLVTMIVMRKFHKQTEELREKLLEEETEIAQLKKELRKKTE